MLQCHLIPSHDYLPIREGRGGMVHAYGVRLPVVVLVQLKNLVEISANGTVMVGYGLSPHTKDFRFGQWTPFRMYLPLR